MTAFGDGALSGFNSENSLTSVIADNLVDVSFRLFTNDKNLKSASILQAQSIGDAAF